MKKLFSALVVGGLALVVAGPAAGDDKKVPFSDPDFVTMAAVGGMAEVELGKLAHDKAAAADVKKFGEQMVADHTKANEKLKAVARSAGLTVPTKLDAKHQAEYDRFRKLSGAEFDKAYVEHMLKDHEEDVALFKQASKEAKDAALRQFAADTLPTLEHHLEMVRKLYAAHGK
jgi:putative membrane protein